MSSNKDWLTIGKLVSPQGLGGEIRVKPSSDFPERFTKPGLRWLQNRSEPPQEIQLISGRKLPGKSIYVVRFTEVNNRNEAEALIGCSLLVPASSRPNLAKGEFHLLDLVGLEAKLSTKEAAIGRVTDLTSAGNDLLEIQLIGGRKVLIPFVKQIVPEINLKEGWLLLSPPPGLLDL